MLPTLATLDQLKARVDVADDARATARLEDASTAVRSVARENYVDEDGDLLESIPDAIVLVTLLAAARALENPKGVTGEQYGQYSYQISGGGGGGVYLTKQEQRWVRAAANGSVHSLQLSSDIGGTTTVYLSDGAGGDLIPWYDIGE